MKVRFLFPCVILALICCFLGCYKKCAKEMFPKDIRAKNPSISSSSMTPSKMEMTPAGGLDWCKMDMKLKLSKIPKLNEKIEIVFSFTPIDSLLPHTPIDKAMIYLNGLQYVKGDTLWEGEIKKGKNVTLKVWAKPVWGGIYKIGAATGYCGDSIDMEIENKNQEKVIKRLYCRRGENVITVDTFSVKGQSKPSSKFSSIIVEDNATHNKLRVMSINADSLVVDLTSITKGKNKSNRDSVEKDSVLLDTAKIK